MTSMLHAAAARSARPLQRMRCMTCTAHTLFADSDAAQPRGVWCPTRFIVTPAHLGLDEGVGHGGNDLQQHGRHIVVGLLACRCGGVTQEHAIRTPANIALGDQLEQRQPADVDLVQDVLPEV